MVVSDSKQFLFVHVQKTGGSTIRKVLTENFPDIKEVCGRHAPFRYAEQRRYIQYYKVAFVRNPFDRLVSWYCMIRDRGTLLSAEEKEQNPSYNKNWQYVLERAKSFEAFVVHCSGRTNKRGWRPFARNQVDWLTDKDGKVGMDFVGRFESFSDDVTKLCRRVGIGTQDIPHENKSQHAEYRQYYTTLTRRIVAERFAKDIATFGYTF